MPMRPILVGLVALGAGVGWVAAGDKATTAPASTEDFVVRPVVAPFRLSDARGRYVALHFLLKTECPICLRHTRTYVERAHELPSVVQVFLKPDEPQETLKWIGKAPLGPLATPVIYHDPDAKLAERFGIPNGYKFHGQVVHYPALVLIDPQGHEVFRYVGKATQDRFGFDQLKAKVADLEKTADESEAG